LSFDNSLNVNTSIGLEGLPKLQLWTRLVKVRRRFQSWSFGLQRRNH